MAILCGEYNELVQAIEDIFPAATPELEEVDAHGFSMFFPHKNLGFSLRIHDDRPIALTVFTNGLPFGNNQRIAIMYEIDEEWHNFILHFKATYEALIEQLEYRLWKLRKPTISLLTD